MQAHGRRRNIPNFDGKGKYNHTDAAYRWRLTMLRNFICSFAGLFMLSPVLAEEADSIEPPRGAGA
jgi:hypothetical protein